MAKKKDYVPSKNGDKIAWANNLNGKIPTDGPAVGESAGDITEVQSACDEVVKQVNAIKDAKTTYQNAVKAATLAMGAGIKVIRQHAQHMKTNIAYTEPIGEDLGIVGDEHTVDVPNSKPSLIKSKVPSGYQFDFNLMGFFDGIHIYRKRPADAAFSYLATDTSSPYIDTEPMVNGTQYYAYFMLNDDEVGQQSDVVTVQI